MNRRLLTILLVAFVIAGICAWLVYRLVACDGGCKADGDYASGGSGKGHSPGSGVHDRRPDDHHDVGSAPKGAILKPEDAVGRGVISEIYQGEPILESRLAGVGSGGGLAPQSPTA
jgi:pilus assembly protein CpaB